MEITFNWTYRKTTDHHISRDLIYCPILSVAAKYMSNSEVYENECGCAAPCNQTWYETHLSSAAYPSKFIMEKIGPLYNITENEFR